MTITPDATEQGFLFNAHDITFRQNGHTYDSKHFYDGWLWHENNGIKRLNARERFEIELEDTALTFRQGFEIYYEGKLILRFP